MNQISRIALVALLFLATQADSKPSRTPLHHLVLGTGISVDIPDGWMACDPTTNVALHNAPRILAIENFCSSIRAQATDKLKPEVHVFLDSDEATRLMMGSFLERGYNIPDEYIANPTPQLLNEFEELFCKGIVAHSGFPISTCALHPTTFGGRPALIGESETRPSARGRFVGRVYLAASKVGAMSFVFAGAAPLSAKAQATIDQVAATMRIEPPMPVAAPQLISLTPVAGLTIAIPKGWLSCDGPTDTTLGQVQDPLDSRSSACPAWLVTDHVIRMLDPASLHFVTLDVSSVDGGDQSDMAAHVTAGQVAEDHDQDCASLTADDAKTGFKLLDCRSEVTTLGGHPAKAVTLLETGRPDPTQFTANLKMRVIYVPIGTRLYTVSLMTSSALAPDFDATAEAILSSVAFQ